MNTIDNVNVRISPFCRILVSYEVHHLSYDCMALILIGMMPLCPGGILMVGFTIPIVAFCSKVLVYVKNLPSLYIAILFLIPSI